MDQSITPLPFGNPRRQARQQLDRTLLFNTCGDAIDLALAVSDTSTDDVLAMRPALMELIRAARVVREQIVHSPACQPMVGAGEGCR